MKKFSQLRQVKRVFEQEETQAQQTDGSVKVEVSSTPEQKEETNTQDTKTAVIKFFSKIFESREMAHVYHLTVKGEEGSHAKHLALGDYYDKILGMLDELIEVYQGEFEVIEGYDAIDTSSAKSTDTIKYFTDLVEFIKTQRNVCFKEDDTHYFNIIDDMLVLIYKTLYKLKYNK